METGRRMKFDEIFDAVNRWTGQVHRGGPFRYRGTIQGTGGRVTEAVDMEGEWMQFSSVDFEIKQNETK